MQLVRILTVMIVHLALVTHVLHASWDIGKILTVFAQLVQMVAMIAQVLVECLVTQLDV